MMMVTPVELHKSLNTKTWKDHTAAWDCIFSIGTDTEHIAFISLRSGPISPPSAVTQTHLSVYPNLRSTAGGQEKDITPVLQHFVYSALWVVVA